MTTIIAAAQSISIAGDIEANVREHLRFIAAAHAASVQMLVFPELSLSGYELAQMQRCVVDPQDRALAPLREQAKKTGMVITVGAPLGHGTALPAIASITLYPDGSVSVYRKHHLHGSEVDFASPGPETAALIPLQGERVGQAICADIGQPSHAAKAAQAGATLYLAGVLVSEAGYAADARALQQYARQHKMGTLMANHGGPSGGYVSAGKSAFWAPGGTLVAATPGVGSYLLIARKIEADSHTHWSGHTVTL